jgi:hypothetical protein
MWERGERFPWQSRAHAEGAWEPSSRQEVISSRFCSRLAPPWTGAGFFAERQWQPAESSEQLLLSLALAAFSFGAAIFGGELHKIGEEMSDSETIVRKPMTPAQREARKVFAAAEAKKALSEPEKVQKAFHENRERLRAERLAREAEASNKKQ